MTTEPEHARDDGAAGTVDRPRRAELVVLAGIMLAGAALRLSLFLQDRSLWLDEQMLGVGIATLSWKELLGALPFEQVAPPLYLWVQRAAWLLFGRTDTALRIPVLVAGLLIVPLAWWLARRAAGARAALCAAALIAITQVPVRYGVEAKPYGIEALVAALLLLAALPLVGRRQAPDRAWLVLGAAGVLGITLATSAVFVLAGVGGALLCTAAVRARRGAWWRLALLAGAWGATFLPIYLRIYRPVQQSSYMQGFAQGLKEDGGSQIDWALVSGMFGDERPPDTRIAVLLAALLLLPGLVALHRRAGAGVAALFGLPIAVTAVAVATRAWPPMPRMLLFVAPAVCVVASAGLVFLVDAVVARRAGVAAATGESWWWPPPRVRGVALLLALMVLPAAHWTLVLVRHPEYVEGPRPLVHAARARAEAGEPLYVYARSMPAWILYSTDWSRPESEREARRLVGVAQSLGPNSGHTEWATPGCTIRPSPADTGMRAPLLVGGPKGVRLDARWAPAEAARLRAAAAPGVSVLISAASAAVRIRLLNAVERAGGVVSDSMVEGVSRLYRVRFPSSPSSPLASGRIVADSICAVPAPRGA